MKVRVMRLGDCEEDDIVTEYEKDNPLYVDLEVYEGFTINISRGSGNSLQLRALSGSIVIHPKADNVICLSKRS